MEQWVKWSSPLPDDLPGDWVSIQKSRFLRRFRVTDDEIDEVGAESTALLEGCNVELTGIDLEHSEREWWSLSFEAYGAPQRVVENLEAVVNWFAERDRPPASFGVDDSFAYPAWLERCLTAG